MKRQKIKKGTLKFFQGDIQIEKLFQNRNLQVNSGIET
jgi:hypothetical protein